jgi:hypothetical protein
MSKCIFFIISINKNIRAFFAFYHKE